MPRLIFKVSIHSHIHFTIDSLNLHPEGDAKMAYDRASMNPHIRHALNCPSLQTIITALMDTIEEEQRTLNTITTFIEHSESDRDIKALLQEYVLVQNEYITRLRKIRTGTVFAVKHASHLERKLERHARRIKKKSDYNTIEF